MNDIIKLPLSGGRANILIELFATLNSSPIQVSALIDTGADITGGDSVTWTNANFKPTDFTADITNANGVTQKLSKFDGYIRIVGFGKMIKIFPTGNTSSQAGHILNTLLGNDVLRHYRFTYDGGHQYFILEEL